MGDGPHTSFKGGKLWHISRTLGFCKKSSGSMARPIHLCTAYGGSDTKRHVWPAAQRLYGLHSLKYLLSGPSPEKFTDPVPRG